MGSGLASISIAEPPNCEEETSDEEDFADAEEDIVNNIMAAEHRGLLNTDAVDSKLISKAIVVANQMKPKFTLETVKVIESELDSNEKVSLVFLLYEQEDIALQSIIVEKENMMHNIISTNYMANLFKSKHKSQNWQLQFIEALCIIKNYGILKRLGYEKEELKQTYLPSNPYASINVCTIRKALYIFCESFKKQEKYIFIKNLKLDFRSKNFPFIDYETDNLETYLLQCFSSKYISKNNFSNLISVLKRMELSSNAEVLELVLQMQIKRANPLYVENGLIDKRGNFDFKNDEHKKVNSSLNNSEIRDQSVIGDSSIVKTVASSECYAINPQNVGICMIINQEEFYMCEDDSLVIEKGSLEPLERRIGSSLDRDKLAHTFRSLGFRIIIKENLRHDKFHKEIDEVLKTFKPEDSCFFLCILSHGIKGYVYSSNSLQMSLKRIEYRLVDPNYFNLIGKPKVMVVQSCQGKVLQKVLKTPVHRIRTDGPSFVPQECDLLVCMSTVDGFVSIRSEDEGSWYIQTLCEVLKKQCDSKHFESIMKEVLNKIIQKIWIVDGEPKTMVPVNRTTLSKNLFLPRVL